MDRRLGVLAFGDSITNGGGELQWGVALQSWALWTARGLGVPYTGCAVDGATAADVVGEQIPRFLAQTAAPDARYDVGCLYVGRQRRARARLGRRRRTSATSARRWRSCASAATACSRARSRSTWAGRARARAVERGERGDRARGGGAGALVSTCATSARATG